MGSVAGAIGEAFCCGTAIRGIAVTYRFKEGSKVYSIDQAKKGVIEAIVIKNVRIINNSRTSGTFVNLYVDTFNGLWNEWDLCTDTEARALAIAYLQRQREAILIELGKCVI